MQIWLKALLGGTKSNSVSLIFYPYKSKNYKIRNQTEIVSGHTNKSSPFLSKIL